MSNLTHRTTPQKSRRHDGWTDQRRHGFLAALAEHGNVSAAAQKVGMDRSSAYKLKKREDAAEFALAWEESQQLGYRHMHDVAIDRALYGVKVPVFYKGEVVGERIWYDNRLLMFMLRHTNSQQFGPYAADEAVAERITRMEGENEAKRLDQLERAEALLASIEASIDEMENDTKGEAALNMREALHALRMRRDRMQSLVYQLRSVDTLRAAEASIDQCVAAGRYSVRRGQQYKDKLRKGGSG